MLSTRRTSRVETHRASAGRAARHGGAALLLACGLPLAGCVAFPDPIKHDQPDPGDQDALAAGDSDLVPTDSAAGTDEALPGDGALDGDAAPAGGAGGGAGAGGSAGVGGAGAAAGGAGGAIGGGGGEAGAAGGPGGAAGGDSDTPGDSAGGDADVSGGDLDVDPVEAVLAALYAQDPVPNVGWIGGACEAAAECTYTDSECLPDAQGFPDGMCTLDCAQFCPDRAEATDTTTFCVDQAGAVDGMCVSRCDFSLLTDGCRPGYACEPAFRHGDTTTVRSVCLPDDGSEQPPGQCYAELIADGVDISTWNAQADLDTNEICWVEAPMRLESPVRGVDFRYRTDLAPDALTVNCRFGEAMVRLAELLAELDIVEVEHIGIYNCRVISGTTTLSQHAFANGIDLHAFKRADGTWFDVEDHWEHDTTVFGTEQGQWLYDLAWEMHNRQIFNIILTPNYNAAHDNHFHVDLTPGSNYIHGPQWPGYIGPNWGDE